MACTSSPEVPTKQVGRLGTVRIFEAEGDKENGVVFLFSDAKGWGRSLDATANRLAARGATVVGVDLPQYLKGLAASDDGCHYVLSEIEAFAQEIEREEGFERYRSPILAGSGEGGTLAYAALAQSPAATVAGAASVDPAPALGTKVPLCPGAPSSPAPGGGFTYGAKPDLPGWWLVSTTDPKTRELVTAAHGELVDTGKGDPAARVATLIEPKLTGASGTEENAIADLPLVEYPVEKPSDLMAIIYSGDGGWRDLDKEIGELLQERGVPVVGVDCLRYFWQPKSPEEVADDLADIIRTYGNEWHASKVILAGYSFGASILPFAVNRLPEDVRDRIVQISLLGLAPRADFEFHVTGWLGAEADENSPLVLPEIERIDPEMIQCFYGADEDDTLCRAPELSRTQRIRTTGSHHFDGDYPGLAKRILAGARHRMTERSQPGPSATPAPTPSPKT